MNEKFSGGKEQYLMFDLDVLHPEIWYWENVISYPKELLGFINDIESNKLSHKSISPWKPWTASDDDSVVYGATKNILRDSVNESTGDEKLDQRILYIINSLRMAVDMCYDRYMDGHGIDKSNYRLDTSHFPIKRWNVGSDMGPHFDGQDGNSDLAYSLVMYLNHDYEGGEISFPDHNITLKPKEGSLIMFPSQLPFIHKVNPVVSGDRYMTTTSAWRI